MLATLRKNRGFTIIEMVIVLLLFGMMTAIAVPRAFKTTPRQEVDRAANQLARDLDGARLRAMATKRIIRVTFDETRGFYAAFIDVTEGRTGDIQETAEEARNARLLARGSIGAIPGVLLPEHVDFSKGSASWGPLGGWATDPITLADDRVEFTARGMVRTIGGGGVVYISHEDDPSVVAAVTISGSGAIRPWRYANNEWK